MSEFSHPTADLSGTDFINTDLTGTYLASAILAGARNLTPEQVRSARNHGEGALLPDGFWAQDSAPADAPSATPPSPAPDRPEASTS